MISEKILVNFGAILKTLKVSETAFKNKVGLNAYNQYLLENRVPALMKLSETTSPENTFYTFFVLGKPVTKTQLSELLGAEIIEEFTANNFIEKVQQEIETTYSPKISINFYELSTSENKTETIHVISDIKRIATNQNLDDEYVMNIGGASKSLAKTIIKEKDFRKYFVGKQTHTPKALDIGCGSGIQALILAKLGYETYATDISEKALQYTKYNALINNVEIKTIKGSLFEPIQELGIKFDLIVSNPPFVITAEKIRENNKYTYRDGGMKHDELLMSFIKQVPEHLEEKGISIFLGNWEETYTPETPQTWEQKFLNIIPKNTDTWIIKRQTQKPEEYVKLWMDDAQNYKLNPTEYENQYSTWLQDFIDRKVTEISFGYFILQKSSEQKTWIKLENGSQYLHSPTGNTILQTLVTKENLRNYKAQTQNTENTSIFDLTYTRAKDVTEERYYIPGQSDPHSIYMAQGANLGRKKQLTSLEAGFLGASDGQLSAKQICEAIAYLLTIQTQNTETTDNNPNNQETLKQEIYQNIKAELESFIINSTEEGFFKIEE